VDSERLMDIDEIIKRISKKTGLKKEDILKMVNEKKKKAGGFLTDESAVRVLASDFGVNVEYESVKPQVSISDIIQGLNDVTVFGRVIRVYPIRTFQRENGAEGKVGRIVIADKSGIIRVSLWNDKSKIIEDIKLFGKIVKVSHGYVKRLRNGLLELNVGERGSIEVCDEDVEKELPELREFVKRINEIKGSDREVNIAAEVKKIYPLTEFKRRDEKKGKLRRGVIADSTGSITTVFWNEKAELPIKNGTNLIIFGAKVRRSDSGELELHVEDDSNVDLIQKLPTHIDKRPKWRIKDLKPGMHSVKILVKVRDIGEIVELERKEGEKVSFRPLIVYDETGLARLNLWDEKAFMNNLSRGSRLLLINASTRSNNLIINLGSKGSILLNPPHMDIDETITEQIVEVSDVKEGGPQTIEGTILTEPVLKEVLTAKGEKVKVSCFLFGNEKEKVEVSLWRKLASYALKLRVGDKLRLKNVYVKRDFKGTTKVTSGALTSIEKVASESER